MSAQMVYDVRSLYVYMCSVSVEVLSKCHREHANIWLWFGHIQRLNRKCRAEHGLMNVGTYGPHKTMCIVTSCYLAYKTTQQKYFTIVWVCKLPSKIPSI